MFLKRLGKLLERRGEGLPLLSSLIQASMEKKIAESTTCVKDLAKDIPCQIDRKLEQILSKIDSLVKESQQMENDMKAVQREAQGMKASIVKMEGRVKQMEDLSKQNEEKTKAQWNLFIYLIYLYPAHLVLRPL